MNVYAYVNGNVVNLTDPLGLAKLGREVVERVKAHPDYPALDKELARLQESQKEARWGAGILRAQEYRQAEQAGEGGYALYNDRQNPINQAFEARSGEFDARIWAVQKRIGAIVRDASGHVTAQTLATENSRDADLLYWTYFAAEQAGIAGVATGAAAVAGKQIDPSGTEYGRVEGAVKVATGTATAVLNYLQAKFLGKFAWNEMTLAREWQTFNGSLSGQLRELRALERQAAEEQAQADVFDSLAKKSNAASIKQAARDASNAERATAEKLYRGVPKGHPRFRQAQHGVAQPQGSEEPTPDRLLRYRENRAGAQTVNATEFTTEREVAARKAGPEGVVIEVRRSDVQHLERYCPDVDKYQWEHGVFVEGTVQGTPTIPNPRRF